MGAGNPPDPPEYVGPLDLVPGAVVAYSLRAMTGGSTENVVTIENGNTTDTQAFPLVDNAVDVAAVATFLNGEDGLIRVLHDQGSAGADVSNEDASQSLWVPSYLGGRPGVSAGNMTWTSVEDVTWPLVKATVFVVGKARVDIKTTGLEILATFRESGGGVSFLEDDDYIAVMFGAIDTGIHIFEAAWEQDSRLFLIDGVAQEVTTDNSGTVDAIPTNPMQLTVVNGSVTEVIAYATILSSGDRTAIRQNIATYYGITL